MGQDDSGLIIVVFAGGDFDCHECGKTITKQEDQPVMFFCEGCNEDHIWHKDCLPPYLRRQLHMFQAHEKASMN